MERLHSAKRTARAGYSHRHHPTTIVSQRFFFVSGASLHTGWQDMVFHANFRMSFMICCCSLIHSMKRKSITRLLLFTAIASIIESSSVVQASEPTNADSSPVRSYPGTQASQWKDLRSLGSQQSPLPIQAHGYQLRISGLCAPGIHTSRWEARLRRTGCLPGEPIAFLSTR